MKLKKSVLSLLLSGVVLLAGCSGNGGSEIGSGGISSETDTESETSISRETEITQDGGQEADMLPDKIDMTRWQYNEDTDVYWQTGIVYCGKPADETYENLGIYVPGAYMRGIANGDGTYTCEINDSGTVEGYTAKTAPMVIPVETPGYSAMAAPTGYVDSTSRYTDAGFVYVYAGCRGRDVGAPAGAADLKAAIRYIRYYGEMIPGSTERIFSFGMSGGGAQSALLGATGDSSLYTPYLEDIKAVSGVSDGVAGSMCWCPITSLDYASEAYEWNLGVTRASLEDDMQKLSDDMAKQFALYINELGLKDGSGNVLTLAASDQGIYQAGSYYDYLKTVIETSLNNFLEDTSFPYTVEERGRGGFGGPGGFGGRGESGGAPEGFGGRGEPVGAPEGFGGRGEPVGAPEGFGGRGEPVGAPEGFGGRGEPGDGPESFEGAGEPGGGLEDSGRIGGFGADEDRKFPGPDGAGDYYARDGIERNETAGKISLQGTYETVQNYIDALNGETPWVTYDSTANSAVITSIADFVCGLKTASKNLGAFDALDESQGENILFGDGDGKGQHFDAVMAELLAGSDYEAEFAADLERKDGLGVSVKDRVNMYNPLYYLCDYYEGYGTANVASHWRIRTGINQSDTALTTEVNLALALENYGADVDFETVWGQAHVEAERTGNSMDNFIQWVRECCPPTRAEA